MYIYIDIHMGDVWITPGVRVSTRVAREPVTDHVL